jgi:hypothetical protein
MNTTIDKQELIDWITEIEDLAMLKNLQSLKESAEGTGDWWDEISEAAKESIRRGEEDTKAGRVYTSEEFWKKIQKRREKQLN